MRRVKSRFAYNHYDSAVECAISAADIERTIIKTGNVGKTSKTISIHEEGIKRKVGRWSAIRTSYVIASIIQSVSFLDSFINEYVDKIEEEVKRGITYTDVDTESAEKITSFIDTYNKIAGRRFLGLPTFNKYQFTLYASENNTFDEGGNPYQSADLVRRLRNYLLHHEPEWIRYSEEEDAEPSHKLGQALKTKDFFTSPLHDPSEHAYFPNLCMSSSLSEWCIKSASEFVKEFDRRLGADNVNIDATDRNSIKFLEERTSEIESIMKR